MFNCSLKVCSSRRVTGDFIHFVSATKSRSHLRPDSQATESPFLSIPKELKNTNNFLLYKLTDPQKPGAKRAKRPVHPSTGRPLKNWQQPEEWMSFADAHARYIERPDLFDGLGYAMSGNRLICVDIDRAKDASGDYTPLAKELVRTIPGWVEVSASGNLHIWTRGDWPKGKSVNSELGIEIFYNSGFVALTGIAYDTNRAIPAFEIDPRILEHYSAQKPQQGPLDTFEQYCKRDPNLTLIEARRIVLEELVPTPNREDWLRVGMALHFQFEGDPEALAIWDEFSAQEGCGEYLGYNDVQSQWESFRTNHPNPVTFASLRQTSRQHVKAESVLRDNPFVTLNLSEHQPISYLLKGLVEQGIALFNGASNAGKTTLMAELVSCVTHLCPEDHFLRVRGRRKVIYLTEDVGQIARIFRGKLFFGGLNASPEEVNEWIKVISTKKFTHDELCALISAIAKTETVSAVSKRGAIELPPLCVIDTASATMMLEDENKNSEVSDYIASLKAAIEKSGVSIWIVAHTPKASGNLDVSDLTARGAGAWGANVQTVIGIEREKTGNRTTLSLGKSRITTQFNELEFTTTVCDAFVEDEYGDPQTVSYVIGSLEQSTTAKRMARKDRERQEKTRVAQGERANELSDMIMAHVREFPYQNRETLRESVKGNNGERKAVIDKLIASGYLTESKTTPEENKASGGLRKILRLNDKKYPPYDFDV